MARARTRRGTVSKVRAKVRATGSKVRTGARKTLDRAVAVGQSVLKNMAARRARRQAAIVNALAKETTVAKKMNARATRKTNAAAQAKKKLKG